MITRLPRIFTDEAGATAIEYGLIAMLVALGALGAMTALGDELSTMYEGVQTKVENANELNQ